MPMAFLSVRPGVCGRRCDNPPGCFRRDEDHSARYLLMSKNVNVQIHRLIHTAYDVGDKRVQLIYLTSSPSKCHFTYAC